MIPEVGSELCRQPLNVVVKGGGDLGTGVTWRLHRCGFRVMVTEIARPTVIRRSVAFATAVFEDTITVENVVARLVVDAAEVNQCWTAGEVPVISEPDAALFRRISCAVVVDAVMAKRNTGTGLEDAPVVIALGPGFTVGTDCHAVVETNRGHSLGRVLLEGGAEPDTGVPGTLARESRKRVLRSPSQGVFRATRAIGDRVQIGETVATVDGEPIRSNLDGVVRGLLQDGLPVHPGFKVGDVDPRGVVSHCFTISDKALAVGGGVLEATLFCWRNLEATSEGDLLKRSLKRKNP